MQGPPGGTEDRLRQIRFIFLAFSIASAAVLAAVAAFAGADRRPEQIAVAALLPLLVWKWVAEYRGRRLPLTLDLAEPAALLIVGATSHDPTSILILLYARISARTLDASSRRVGMLSGAYAAAFLGSVSVSSSNWGLTPQSLPFIFLASGFALAPPVMHLLSDTMARLVRTTARERSLREALDELSAAITVDAIREAAASAVAHLVAGTGLRVHIDEREGTVLRIVAVGGGLDEPADVAATAGASADTPGVVAPVVGGQTPVHIVLDGAVDVETRLALTALAEHIASRLDAARLSNDLDISERNRMEAVLRVSEDNFRHVFEGNPLPMWLHDADSGRFLAVNNAALKHYGYGREEFLKMSMVDLAVDGATSGGEQHRARDGRIIEVQTESSRIVFQRHDAVLLLARDVGEQRELQRRLEHSASHDPLTGLANVVLLRERVVEAIKLGQRRGEHQHAMLVLDLDDFKTVNDTLGHTLGDRVIAVVGARLGRCVKRRDTAARIGGDEFAYLLEGVSDAETAIRVAARVIHEIQRPIHLRGRTIRISASCGIAFLRPDHLRPEDLLSDADVAMYAAKAQGAGASMVFDPELRAALRDRLNLEHDLTTALRRDELGVVYQPQVDLVSGRVFAVEALARWQHPERGAIPPDVFIPLAERMGIVSAIDEWVLRAGLRSLRQWTDEGLHDIRLAVNLSGQDLGREDLVAIVRHALLESMLDPWRLELELTETAAVTQPEGAIQRLQELRAMGVRIAIDDFGTGFSMFSRLRDLPIDRLKIDRSFVTDLARDDDARAIVGSTIAMGHALGLDLCAEGVESDATAEVLRDLRCDSAQGYHFSRPLPAAELLTWLRARSTPNAVISLVSAPPPDQPRRSALRQA